MIIHGSHCKHTYLVFASMLINAGCNNAYMLTIGDVLKKARESLELSQEDIAAKVRKITGDSFSRAALAQIESGATKNPKPRNLQAACDAMGIDFRSALNGSLEWLDNYITGEIIRPSLPEPDNSYPATALGAFSNIPVVGSAQLGDNGHWSELEYPIGHGDGYISYPTRDKNAYALRCVGDSMKPRIRDGEFVIVEPNSEPIPGDEILLKTLDGRVMVKTFLYRRDEKIHVLSVNEAHPPQAFDLDMIDKIHPVVAIVKKALWVPITF